MPAELISRNAKEVELKVTIKLDPKSMLKSEQNIRNALNEAGCLASAEALSQFDTDGSPIFVGETKLTSKGKQNKVYQTPWGEAEVDRHVYQSSKGGKQHCPLEQDARVILTSTPGFAKMVSFKYAEMGSSRALQDLEENHARPIARSYMKSLGDVVGGVAVAKEEKWEYAPPEMGRKVASIAIGLDGTCMLMTQDGWREAMVGTISLYSADGERLHTIQMGAIPQHGKDSFFERLDREIDRIKARYPKATYVGIADGARCNWTFLDSRTSRQTTDFWHAAGYLGKAAEAMFPGKKNAAAKSEWLEEARRSLKEKVGSATRILRSMDAHLENSRMKKSDRETLEASSKYFQNNKKRMSYAKNRAENLPIGSGVTEAACKTLIKQRLCSSGMRWKEEGAQAVISLRSLTHTDSRWEQFWSKIDQYGPGLVA